MEHVSPMQMTPLMWLPMLLVPLIVVGALVWFGVFLVESLTDRKGVRLRWRSSKSGSRVARSARGSSSSASGCCGTTRGESVSRFAGR
jgi:hypothetical protein